MVTHRKAEPYNSVTVYEARRVKRVELHKGKEPWYLVMAYNASDDPVPTSLQDELRAIGLLPATYTGYEVSDITTASEEEGGPTADYPEVIMSEA